MVRALKFRLKILENQCKNLKPLEFATKADHASFKSTKLSALKVHSDFKIKVGVKEGLRPVVRIPCTLAILRDKEK